MAAKVFWAYMEANPAFALALNKVLTPMGKCFEKAKGIYNRADDALDAAWDKGRQKLGLGKGNGNVKPMVSEAKSPSIPNGCINENVPNCVKSRINIRNGDGTKKEPGLEWSWRKHGGIENKNKSQFTISKEEVKIVLQDKKIVQSPVGMIEQGRNIEELEKRLFVREVDSGKIIGNLRSKDGSIQPTKIITVITDYKGNLNSSYPGPFKHVFDK